MKFIILTYLAGLLSCQVFSQMQSANWVFGDSAGLSFNGGIVTNFKSSLLSAEPSASISDSAGNLLFYTNGSKVWSKDHTIMENGEGLDIGALGDYNSSVTQGVVIIPKPHSYNLYYRPNRQNG